MAEYRGAMKLEHTLPGTAVRARKRHDEAGLARAGPIAYRGQTVLSSALRDPVKPPVAAQPKRFHGTITLDTTRVGRDAGRIADEVLEIEAEIPSGAPPHVVRAVTENSRTLKFTSQGFEED